MCALIMTLVAVIVCLDTSERRHFSAVLRAGASGSDMFIENVSGGVANEV